MGDKSISEIFANIDSYLYKYTPEAQSLYSDKVDDQPHVGPMAQELKENPVTASTVEEDENGYLEVNTNQLCLALSAVVADLSKRVNELEEIVNGR